MNINKSEKTTVKSRLQFFLCITVSLILAIVLFITLLSIPGVLKSFFTKITPKVPVEENQYSVFITNKYISVDNKNKVYTIDTLSDENEEMSFEINEEQYNAININDKCLLTVKKYKYNRLIRPALYEYDIDIKTETD